MTGQTSSFIPNGHFPQKNDGHLLSERNISGIHKAHSNYRVIEICLNIGVGVGTAVAVQNNTELRDADILQVQKILKRNGNNV